MVRPHLFSQQIDHKNIIIALINSCEARGLKLDLNMAQITLPGQDSHRPAVHVAGITSTTSSSSLHYMPPTSLVPSQTSYYITTYSPIHTISISSYPPIMVNHTTSILSVSFSSPSPTSTPATTPNPTQSNTNTGAAPRLIGDFRMIFFITSQQSLAWC
ncbi:hypothetical protein BJ165DRAFT_1491243 [Panaeolus papilionaceus]|nr:hypothetical protein BJ165DRAFT_1491243 [Panaeolus papilionaceus]